MNRITFDILPGSHGPEVANLQEALQLFLDRNVLDLPDEEGAHHNERLRPERHTSEYGEATAALVRIVQARNGIPDSGDVHEDTARVFNDLLARLGALDERTPRTFVVAGGVTDQDGRPYAGLQVAAYHAADGPPIRLGADRSDTEGRYTVRFEGLSAVPELTLRVEAVDEQGRIVARSARQPLVEPLTRVDLSADRPAPPVPQCRVEGRVVLDNGAPADGLALRLHRLEFGGQAQLMREASASADGQYALAFDAPGRAMTLEVRAVSADGHELTLSRPLVFPADTQAIHVDLVAPTTLHPSEAEYSRLAAALTPHVGEMGRLAQARENDQQRDLTTLNAATGWDARPIALAATAQRLAQDPQVGLRADALYGLFRAGLPHDPHLLAQVGADDVAVALAQLNEHRIVAMTTDEITEFTDAFAGFSRTARLALRSPGSQTTYAQMLQTAGVGGDADSFADIFLTHRGDPADLWSAVRKANIPEEAISRLQWQGKLAFLAGNSGAVTEHLMTKLQGQPLADGHPAELASPAALVAADLYDAEHWTAEVRALADGDDELAALIPDAYGGKTTAARLDAYCADMARKIRISYPTEVVTRMVQTDKIPLDGAKNATVKLLQAAAPQGFTLSRTPIQRFLSGGATLPADMAQADVDAAAHEIRTLHRLYQVTPDNDSMIVLKSLGLDSAFDITALPEQEFYRVFDKKYVEVHGKAPTGPQKRLVWRKAQQVSSMTYTIFGVTKKVDGYYPVSAVSGSAKRREDEREGLKQALQGYPTMEQLFGSMDFCECEHCRSVLSPAAYLVDLLQFVEAEPAARANFLAAWQERNGTAYAAGGRLDPYTALIARRPDLPHIPLTCENTNVALPYIDIVNEILEYSVAHNGLSKQAAGDTGDATTAELLAEPQNVIVEAYRPLREARYPLNLPFDLWLQTVREFCAYTDMPLHRMLEVFRKSDDFQPAAPGYGWAAIFLESLGISPDERTTLTRDDPLADWWTLYGYDTEGDATDEATQDGQRVDLNSARALSRRLGVTYTELAQLVRTKFVNPHLDRLGLLYQLPATIAELQEFRRPDSHDFLADHRELLAPAPTPAQQAAIKALSDDDWTRLTHLGAFEDRVSAYADAYGKDTNDVLDELAALDLNGILVLADPDTGCSFDETILRQANGQPAGAGAFVRLNLFVRLWRKLGWTTDELDCALAVFLPGDDPFAQEHAGGRRLETALIYLAHLKALDERLKVGRPSRTRLLTLWADIPKVGKNSLYAQLFLTRSVLKADKVFDHPRGDYLAEGWVAQQGQGKPADSHFLLIKGHLPAIRSALGLTADDVTDILADAKPPIDEARLTVANLSTLHRYGMLAKALRISVHDLITLKTLSGKQPFTPLSDAELSTLDDHPYRQTLAFLEIAEKVKQSGLSIADLDFLLRRRFDEAGPRRQDRPALLTALTTLADGIRAIRAEHAVPTDSEAVTEEFLQQKLGLLLSPVDTETVMRMVRGQEDVDTISVKAFFADVLKRQPVRAGVEAGFLDAGDYPELFEPLTAPTKIEPGDTPAQVAAKQTANEAVLAANRATLTTRRARLVSAFLPVLQDRLIRRLTVSTLAADAQADPALIERLLTDTDLISIEVDGTPKQTLLAAFRAAAADGIEADFYEAPNGDGPRQATKPRLLAGADTALRPARDVTDHVLPPANSARFDGYLAAGTGGPYRFYITLHSPGATAKVTFPHLPTPLFLDKTAAQFDEEFGTAADEYVELQAGVPYRFTFALDTLDGGRGLLTVQGATTPRGPLSQLALYPASGLDAAMSAHTLLRAVLELLAELGLTLREAAHIAAHATHWGDVDLADLPTERSDDAADAAATKRFGWFLRLAEYASLKRELAGGTDALIDVFEANGTEGENRFTAVYTRLGTLARREQAVVQATAETVFPAPANRDFGDDVGVARLWAALKLVERFGAPAAAIQDWTGIAAPTTGAGALANEARFSIARDIKETVKARFDPQTWQRVAQPIFDRLRRQQRDALVAAIMHRHSFSRVEELYEHFLVDPGMEPVVQTSRIRLAIASVQLFIQRCLLNLEPGVHPSAILNAEQWDWMKRYRVWEANRKIFLFPENWLEEEFRDNKTHLFEELQSTLTESDVSADTAEDAFLAYLNGLAALAKLDIVASHLESKPDLAANTLHVFGRTHSTPHKYYYRRFADRMWTPWEPVGVDIDGDHLAPVIWRDRLHLFWVTFLESGRGDGVGPANADNLTGLPKKMVDVEAQLHWSRYVAGEWQPPESGGYQPPVELRVRKEKLDGFDRHTVFVHVRVVDPPDIGAETAANLQAAGVYITLTAPFDQAFYLASRHSAPISVGAQPAPDVPFGVDIAPAKCRPTSYVGAGGKLTVSMRQRIITGPDQLGAAVHPQALTVLGTTGAFTVLPTNNRITLGVPTDAADDAGGNAQEQQQVRDALQATIGEIESLIKPAFFQDAHQVLFMEPELTERTIQQWEQWVTRTPIPEPEAPGWHLDPHFWEQYVKPVYPLKFDPIGPVARNAFHDSVIQPATGVDWLVNAGTGLLFDGQVIGNQGLAGIEVIAAGDVAAATARGAATVTIGAGSAVPADRAVVAHSAATAAGPAQTSASLNLVGGAGLNAALRQNVDSLNQAGLGGRSGLMQ